MSKACWLDGERGTLPPTGDLDLEDQVSDVYQQSIHGGSLAPSQ